MMRNKWLLITAFFLAGTAMAQKSPEDFLGYKMGDRFTPHHRVVAYFEQLAATLPNVKLVYYGETYEHRPLFVAIVSSPENMSNLENIRLDNLKRTGLVEGSPSTQVAINWMQYNVHGNEAVATEAAMTTFWQVADPNNATSKAWLKNQVLIIDPCANPDGKDRYTNWYNQKQNTIMQPDPQSMEHSEPWPGGRPNHYMIDLNRDWAWQTQQETQQRLVLYHQWMPHLFVDYHEQGVNEPFYFAPAAKPLHEQLSAFQHEFQDIYGKNTAKHFDENGWLYFTKERFDLLYPSYGDTYPMYNGAIGMTIEKGGSGRAGIGVLNALKDTVTLRERIEHQHIAGISAVEVTAEHAARLTDEFSKYFQSNRDSPRGKYKSFVIKGDQNPDRLKALLALLDKNHIQYGFAKAASGLRGLDYNTGKAATFAAAETDIVINAYQPKSVLTQILFEPEAKLQDSITYDITSWAMPYAYGLQAYALETRLEPGKTFEKPAFAPNEVNGSPVAYLAPWNATQHAKFLAALLQAKVRVRYAEKAFTINGKDYPSGTLIIHRNGNQYVKDFDKKVTDLANEFEISLESTLSAYVEKGRDFGSPEVRPIVAPKVAVVSGAGVSSLGFGEVWYLFEQELKYPLTVLDVSSLGGVDLKEYHVLILPASWGATFSESNLRKVMEWVRAGGRVIAIDNSVGAFADKEGFALSRYDTDEEKKAAEKAEKEIQNVERLEPYQDRERMGIATSAAGAIYQVKIDPTHPLGFGMGDKFYTLKNNGSRFAYLDKGVNVGIIPDAEAYRFGYIGNKLKPKMPKSMTFGVENHGRGQLIYFADNPIFRAFWENGKLLVANAVFLVGQ